MEFMEMQEQVHTWAEEKGWTDPEILNPDADPTPTEERLAQIALIHLQLSNELELIRKGEPSSGFLETIAVSLPPIARVEGVNAIKVLSKLALVHSEVSEGVDAVLKGVIKTTVVDGKPEGLGSETADVHIRLLQLAGMLNQDSTKDFALKMEYNAQRSFKHGGKLA